MTTEISTKARRPTERPRRKAEQHPVYDMNGSNEDARLDQLITSDDTRFYQCALGVLHDRQRRPP